jgi:hypothetical protein
VYFKDSGSINPQARLVLGSCSGSLVFLLSFYKQKLKIILDIFYYLLYIGFTNQYTEDFMKVYQFSYNQKPEIDAPIILLYPNGHWEEGVFDLEVFAYTQQPSAILELDVLQNPKALYKNIDFEEIEVNLPLPCDNKICKEEVYQNWLQIGSIGTDGWLTIGGGRIYVQDREDLETEFLSYQESYFSAYAI